MHKLGGQQDVGDDVITVERGYQFKKVKTYEGLPKHFEDPHVCPTLVWKVAENHLPRTEASKSYLNCSSYDVMKNKTCAFLHFTDTSTDTSDYITAYGSNGVRIINISREDIPHPFPNNTYYAVLRRASNVGRMRRVSRGRYIMEGEHYKMTQNRYCYWDRNEGLLRSPFETKFLPVALGEDIEDTSQYSDPFYLGPSGEESRSSARNMKGTINKLSSGKRVVLLRSLIGCNCAPRVGVMTVPNRGALTNPSLMFIGNSLYRYGDILARVLMIKGKYVVMVKDYVKSGHRPPRCYRSCPTHLMISQFFESLRINGRGFTCLSVTHNILKAAHVTSGGYSPLLKAVDAHLKHWNIRAEQTFQSHMRAHLCSRKPSYQLDVSHIDMICEVFNRKAFEKYRDGLRSKVRLATIIMKDKALEAARRLQGW
jgi:hypothetical protein